MDLEINALTPKEQAVKWERGKKKHQIIPPNTPRDEKRKDRNPSIHTHIHIHTEQTDISNRYMLETTKSHISFIFRY